MGGVYVPIGLVSASSDLFYFTRSTLGHSRRSNHCNFIKRSFTLPLTGASLIPSPTGVPMLALSLLPVAALFIATAQAAGSFGKNVVPYIPQVPHFHPLVSIPWTVLINFPVIFLRLERPVRPTAKSHDCPMRHHKHQVEQINCPRVCGVAVSPTSRVLIRSFTGPTPLPPTGCSYIRRMLPPRFTSSMTHSLFLGLRPCRLSSMQEKTSNS